MAERDDRETEAYLARIRRTIAESSRLVEQASLRIAETDRLLESQGLTREQVMGFRFTDAQREAVGKRLKAEGLELEESEWSEGSEHSESSESSDYSDHSDHSDYSDHSDPSSVLAERRRKFGMMMKPFQI